MTILDNGYILDGMNTFECEIKRLIDLFVASFCIVFFAPLFVFCYVAIKREDGGPAIFKQERIGRFGRPFTIYKFRSMTIGAETNGTVLSNHSQDKRLTKIGRFLRLRHLDELPQLWNVIKGDMAFVGPRPERQFYIEKIMKKDPRYCYLYQIRPGVTSYATLYNGYTDTIEKMLVRLNMDLYYLEHRSLWLDFRILSLTFLRICFGKKF